MAALSFQDRQDPPEFVRNFGGSNRFVIDYLVEEVLNRQPDDINLFLLVTAPLERFCSSLCAALLDTSESQAQTSLERLEKANLFVIPLDDHRHWFRYHHLFADLLRMRLHQTRPESFPRLYRRAAEWFAQNGLWREAIHYAFLAKDIELSADLVERAILKDGRDFLYSGIAKLIEPFPVEIIQSRRS